MPEGQSKSESDANQRTVIDLLSRAGWVAKSWQSGATLMIQWTEKGKAGMVRWNDLDEEIGLSELNSRQFSLFGLIAYLSYNVGIDDNNVTVIGGSDLNTDEGD